MTSDLDALYKKATANLWVEDPETRTWLSAVWFGKLPAIQVLVARGRDSVEAICTDAYAAGHRRVFGFVDKDFGTSNHARWSVMTGPECVYRLPVHEIENLLLSDMDALLGCDRHTGKRERPDVEQRIVEAAKKRIWWVTCIRFLAETQLHLKEGFPSDPKFNAIQSLQDAKDYLLTSLWFTTTAQTCGNLVDPSAVSQGLQNIHAAVSQEFATNAWRTEFPGKEIFTEIATYLNPTNSGLDFIKSVGDWQRESAKQKNVRVPLLELHDAIRKRIK